MGESEEDEARLVPRGRGRKEAGREGGRSRLPNDNNNTPPDGGGGKGGGMPSFFFAFVPLTTIREL